MHWLKRLTVDNNRLTELGEEIGLMQGLETFWFGMNQIKRCGIYYFNWASIAYRIVSLIRLCLQQAAVHVWQDEELEGRHVSCESVRVSATS